MSAITHGESVRVGVLSHHNSEETKAILNAIDALGHTPVWIHEENFSAHLDDAHHRIQPDVDCLPNRLLLTKSDRPLAELRIADLYATCCPVLNTAPAVQRAMDKYRSALHLHESGLPVPAAYLTTASQRMDDWPRYIDGTGVQKPIIGTNGKHLDRVEPDDPTNHRLDGRQAFVQEYIESPTETASDVRVYVVDDSIVGAMRRHAQNGEWRADVAQGTSVEDVTHELDAKARHIARDAVQALDALGDAAWFVVGRMICRDRVAAGFDGPGDRATGFEPDDSGRVDVLPSTLVCGENGGVNRCTPGGCRDHRVGRRRVGRSMRLSWPSVAVRGRRGSTVILGRFGGLLGAIGTRRST